MTDSNEEVLRRSLDSIDRHRTRLIIGLVVCSLLMVGALYHASGVVHAGTNVLVHEVFVLLSVWTTALTLVVVLQMTVMTKRILRAIELASRK